MLVTRCLYICWTRNKETPETTVECLFSAVPREGRGGNSAPMTGEKRGKGLRDRGKVDAVLQDGGSNFLYGETRGFRTEKLREEYVKYRREGGGVRSQGWSKWTSGQPVCTGSRRRGNGKPALSHPMKERI
jgi:hypothetical protein